MKKIVLFLVFVASTVCAQQEKITPDISFKKDFKIPKIFLNLPGFQNINVRDIAISPDYDEIFFTLYAPKRAFRTILTTKKVDGKWSPFTIATFSGQHHDIEPAFSPDGKQLFFASKRPDEKNGVPRKDYDLWVVSKEDGSWKHPKKLPNTINTEGNEFYPSIANNGTLYFTSEREGSKGKEDIFKSELKNGTYQTPVSLGEGINTKTFEYNAYVSPDETFIIFCSYGRKGSFGKGDLYISFQKNGIWQPAKNLGKLFNSNQIDYCPFVTFDGSYFFYTSEKSTVKSSYKAMNMDYLKEVMNTGSNGTSKIYYLPFKEVLKAVHIE